MHINKHCALFVYVIAPKARWGVELSKHCCRTKMSDLHKGTPSLMNSHCSKEAMFIGGLDHLSMVLQ